MKPFLISYAAVLVLVASSVLCENSGSGTGIDCAPRTNKEAFCAALCSNENDCDEQEECRCDGDCGASCVDPNIKCAGRIARVAHSRKEISGKDFGDTVTYKCRKPYTIFGDDTITCRATGQWDRILPRCALSCVDPGIPQNAKRRGGTRKTLSVSPVGTVLEYWCMPGYERVSGNSTLKCQASGKWDGELLNCQLKSCDVPDIPDNAIINPVKDSYEIGERVSYTCENGFTRQGVRVRECRSKGWTSGDVYCIGRSCGDPGEPMNGKRIGLTFQYKSRVEFECRHGYMLNGPKYLTCLANQRWSGPIPTCRVVDCKTPPVPYNGKVDGVVLSTSLGSKIRFKCKPGFMLRGAQERVCQANGTWSGLNAKCTDFVCLRPAFDGILSPDRQEYNVNSEVTFGCHDDNTLSGSKSASCINVGNKAVWNHEIPKCYNCMSRPIGFQNKRIKKEQLSQGPIKKYYFLNQPDPDKIRLHSRSSWCPYKLENKFIQVDLLVMFTINAIATQGDPREDYWVKYYLIEYSKNGKDWFIYQENGEDKIFIGNNDRNTVKKNILNEPFDARLVRVVPLCNPSGRQECMRLELYGCIDPKECLGEGSTVWFQEKENSWIYIKGVISQVNEHTVNIIHNLPNRVKSPATVQKNKPNVMYQDVIVPLKDVKVGDKVITMWKQRPYYYISEIRDVGLYRCYNRQYDYDGAWTLPADFRARTVHELQFC